MKVEDVMTRDVQSCTQETDLAAAERETPSFMVTPLVLEIVAEKR